MIYVSYDSPLKRCLKDTFLILLCSNNSQVLASLRKLEELAMKFEQAQISRKPSQVGGQTSTIVQKLKTCDDLRSRLIRALYLKELLKCL